MKLRVRGRGDGGELLEVELDDDVGEHLGVLLAVAVGDVDDVGLEDDGVGLGVPGIGEELGDGGDGAVVLESVLAASDAEAEDVVVVVEDLEALDAGGGGEAGDNSDLTDAPDGVAVAGDEAAALHEVLVTLRAGEAADHRPHRAQRSLDTLRDQGRARARRARERMVRLDKRLQRRPLRRAEALQGRWRLVVVVVMTRRRRRLHGNETRRDGFCLCRFLFLSMKEMGNFSISRSMFFLLLKTTFRSFKICENIGE